MKKFYFSVIALLLVVQINVWGQTTTPPVYDDEDKPIDLAIQKAPAPAAKKPVAKPKKVAAPPPAAPQTTTDTTSTTVQTTSTTTAVAPTAIPAPVAPPPETQPAAPATTTTTTTVVAPVPVATPPPPAAAVVPETVPTTAPTTTTTVTTTVPVPTPNTTAPAATAPTTTIQTIQTTQPTIPPLQPPPPDAETKRDAGMDIATALPITFDKYDNNSLSSQDTVDVFKLYARTGEGVGVILIPKNPTMQLAVALLGENGELLSQTQAPQPGAPLAFQTAPLDRNRIIYIQVKDANLPMNAPASELRPYSLELKPIAPPPPSTAITPVPTPTPTTAIAPTTVMPTPTPPAVVPQAAPMLPTPSNDTAAPPQVSIPTPTPTEPAPPPAPKKEVRKIKSTKNSGNLTLYTIAGALVLGGLLAGLMIIRKRRK